MVHDRIGKRGAGVHPWSSLVLSSNMSQMFEFRLPAEPRCIISSRGTVPKAEGQIQVPQRDPARDMSTRQLTEINYTAAG